MTDEDEESMSEGFSASEEEWKPSAKDARGGESSDDDDSDFEESRQTLEANSSGAGATSGGGRKREPKTKSATKQTAIKKRKPAGQSLRSKLYNKYRPPPKTFPSPSSAGTNSPSASTSRTAPKNAKAPNESGEHGNDSSSESSVDDYLVDPSQLDLQSSFFNVHGERKYESSSPAPPIFDCNAGVANLSDSGSEDNNESSAEEHSKAKVFDFGNLLENVNSLERAKETIAKRAAEKVDESVTTDVVDTSAAAMDVHSLLALGEQKQALKQVKHEIGKNESDDAERAPQKLSKTKSTRVKRHTKTRPTSTVVAGDTDDSDWEEVADDTKVSHSNNNNAARDNSLEIHVELPCRQRNKQQKHQQDIEAALKRKLNREIKERQLQLHKTSLLCCIARSYFYNRLLNDTALMQMALKLLPSSNAYPPERGTELKYFQSLVTWFKTAVKLQSPDLYAGKESQPSKRRVKRELLQQIKRKEACCKQDMVFMFVTLLRGMGLQCRLVVNMQPMPLRPAQADLLSITMKRNADADKKDGVSPKKAKVEQGNGVEKEAKSVKVTVSAGPKEAKATHKQEAQKNTKTAANSKKDTNKDTKRAESAAKKEAPKQQNAEEVRSSKDLKRDHTAQSKHTRDTSKENTAGSSSKSRKQAASADKNVVNTEAEIEKHKTLNEVKVQKAKTIDHVQESAAKASTDTVPAKLPKQSQTNAQSEALKKTKAAVEFTPVACRTRQHASTAKPTNKNTATVAQEVSGKPIIQIGSPIIPKIVIQNVNKISSNMDKNARERERENVPTGSNRNRVARSRSKSPKMQISPTFLQTKSYKEKFAAAASQVTHKRAASKSPTQKFQISTEFLQHAQAESENSRILRSRQKSNEVVNAKKPSATIPQLDGADDDDDDVAESVTKSRAKRPQLRKLHKSSSQGDSVEEHDEHETETPDTVAPTTRAKGPLLRKLHKSSSQPDAVEDFDGTAAGSADEVTRKPGAKYPQLNKLQKPRNRKNSDEDFEPSPPKRPKKPAKLPSAEKKPAVDRRVLSTDEEDNSNAKPKRNPTAADIWVEVWSDVEEQWICIELFKGKLHSVEAIRKAASSSFAYVFAFQNDLSIKDVTARYCPHWTTTVRKGRVERGWLEIAISPYYGQRTMRDIREDQELRRIHEEKPMPTAISEYKDNPLYALERHLLKFQAIYPPDAPTLGFVRGEPVYARECVHTLHSREIWLKQARTVRLGEEPYKIVKARPKWDRLTQTVIKDQPLEIFGYWQTQDYEPPTAENGLVPRNAYGNVELFKACMLPKKTVHLKLNGLNRLCKKLGIDCANAVIGFDFHQGACHPLYDGFIVCEEFADTVTAAWHQDQEEQERKELEKHEARVWGNWKKLIRGLLVRERLKKKYNF